MNFFVYNEADNLYVYFSTLKLNSNLIIHREVAIALQSVLQPSELPRYVTLSMQKKEEQLMELVLIVTGIRLFNRDCDRGGEGIDDCNYIFHLNFYFLTFRSLQFYVLVNNSTSHTI